MIDTHQHLLYPDRFRYDWTSGLPALQGNFRLEEYRLAAKECGITQTLFMEVDVPWKEAASEAAFFCSLAEDPANRIAGVVAACRPENENFAAQLELTAHPRLVGYRRILHTQPDELSVLPLFRENIRRLGAAGLTFDLCVLPRQHLLAGKLVDACPETRFILDHCGIPPIASGDLNPWRASLRELARRPNLACKISGIIAYAAGEITAAMLRPVIEHTIECFGWDRVVWGGDWPVCNLTRDLHTWINLLREVLAGSSEDERAKLYDLNARAIYLTAR